MVAIEQLLSQGDHVDGHRSRAKASEYLTDFRTQLGGVAPSLDRDLEDFLTEVVLSAAWYQRRCRGAYQRVLLFIAVNCVAVIGLPLMVVLVSRLAGGEWSAVSANLTTLLTGILALQKTLSAWYTSQQRYATWYKCASDLKSIYYSLIQTWENRTASDTAGFIAALHASTAAGRSIVSQEQEDFYQRLTLPSFDVLDMLTATRSTVSTFVTNLVPNASATSIAILGKRSAITTPGGQTASAPTFSQAADPDQFAFVPGGRRHRSLLKRLEPGERATFADQPGPTLRAAHAPGPPDQANWILYGQWRNQTGNAIQSFTTTWIVPDAPKENEQQIIYLFGGMQPADGSFILQPVLQWGDFGPDKDGKNRTGAFWTVGSWLVQGLRDDAQHSYHVVVLPGTRLVGRISLIVQSGGKFSYRCEFVGLGQTVLNTNPGPELVWCVQTLEAYETNVPRPPYYPLDSDSHYPASQPVSFTDIQIVCGGQPVQASFQAVTNAGIGEHVMISPPNGPSASIDIFFRSEDSPQVTV